MKKWVIKSGIQRKYLRYIMGLLLLAILLSSIGVWIYVRQSLTPNSCTFPLNYFAPVDIFLYS